MCYLHLTMSMWVQYEKLKSAWLCVTSTESIQAPGYPTFLTRYHPPTLEAYTFPTKKPCSSKNWTHFNSLPFDFLHNIGMWYPVLVRCSKIKSVIARLTKQNIIIREPMSYNLKYVPFGYYIHYKVIRYVWVDRCLGPHKYSHGHKWERAHIIKHYPV